MNQNITKKKIAFLLSDLELDCAQKSIIGMLKYLTRLRQYGIDLMAKWCFLEREIPVSINIIYKSYAPTLNDVKLEKTLLKRTK